MGNSTDKFLVDAGLPTSVPAFDSPMSSTPVIGGSAPTFVEIAPAPLTAADAIILRATIPGEQLTLPQAITVAALEGVTYSLPGGGITTDYATASQAWTAAGF